MRPHLHPLLLLLNLRTLQTCSSGAPWCLREAYYTVYQYNLFFNDLYYYNNIKNDTNTKLYFEVLNEIKFKHYVE